MSGDNPAETFAATSGRAFGVLAVVLGVLGVVLGLAGLVGPGGVSWVAVAAGALAMAVGWAVFLRPRLSIEDDELVLRNMLDTRWVPIAAIEEVAARQVLAVRVGERRYTSVAVGSSRRQLRKDDRRVVGDDAPTVKELSELPYAHFVEERIRERATDARQRLGLTITSPGFDDLAAGVRRQWAYPEIAALALTTLGVLVAAAL